MGRFRDIFRRHLSDGDLVLRITGDLPIHKRAQAEQHLSACSLCTARCRDFENLLWQVAVSCSDPAEVDKLEIDMLRVRLVARLEQMPDRLPAVEQACPRKTKHSVGGLIPMNPILAAGLVLAVASISCVFVWMQQTRSNLSSNALLMQAAYWDQGTLQNRAPGIIRQTIKITTPKKTLQRTIYRDVQGRRMPREQRISDSDSAVRSSLLTAEIAWDAPLSVASYQDWHNAQNVREDNIQRVAGDYWVLTTTTPEGLIAAQSLTVRDTDFHPVRRTVSFRNSETVEIAELDYSVLPWTHETSAYFQPDAPLLTLMTPGPRPVAVLPASQHLSKDKLVEAELSARLTLDRLHADTGEQIEVVSGPDGVEVRGITDTEARKHELQKQLDMLPNVTASISSIEGLRTRPSQGNEPSSIKVVEMQTHVTPLEVYYLAHRRDLASFDKLARNLLNRADAISLESRAIDDLQSRFSLNDDASTVARATLSDLLFTHKHKLLSALQDENRLLVDAQLMAQPLGQDQPSDNHNPGLSLLAEQNLILTRELTLSKGTNGRTAETIAADLAISMNKLNLWAHAIQIAPQSSMNPDKKR